MKENTTEQKIFGNISKIHVKGKIMEEKIQDILNNRKLILILDLDNTVVHAKNVSPEEI